jgi:hypothetical protein
LASCLSEAGGDGAIVLDLVEEPLDPIAVFVEAGVEGGRIDALIQRTNVGYGAPRRNFGSERIAVIAAIGQQDALARQRLQHVLAAAAVVRLAFRQLERDRQARGIDEGMDFGRKPASGTAHATTAAAFFSPLAAC